MGTTSGTRTFRYYTGEGSGVLALDRRRQDLQPPRGPERAAARGRRHRRIGVTFDPQDPSRAYAIYANNEVGAFQAFFASKDGGDHWVVPPGKRDAALLAERLRMVVRAACVDPADSDHTSSSPA